MAKKKAVRTTAPTRDDTPRPSHDPRLYQPPPRRPLRQRVANAFSRWARRLDH